MQNEKQHVTQIKDIFKEWVMNIQNRRNFVR